MVKALHRAGIEVILDVVFNHTAEGDRTGPTLSFRGIDNPTYYILEEGGSRYADYTGCGNTLNANHPIVRRMIVDSSALLGRGNARRRLPVRPRVDPGPRPLGASDAEPAGPLGYRVGPGPGRYEAHRRGVGRGRALPGRKLRRRRLEGVERPIPRRHPRLLPRRTRISAPRRPTGWSEAPKSTATRAARPSRASIS